MKLQSKLLTAQLDYDMQNPDGTRRLGFTVQTGVPEVPDWELDFQKTPKGIKITIKDPNGEHVNEVSDFTQAGKFLQDAGQLLREDIQQFPKYQSQIEVLMVRIHKQILQGLQEVAGELNRPFEA